MSTLAVSRRRRSIAHVTDAVVPGWLRPPPLRAGVIERPELVSRLERLTEGPLTVVAAPTGYGKTTLLVSWAASTRRRVAWVSLGSRELGADGIWALVAAALEQAEPQLRLRVGSDSGAGDRPEQMATSLGPLADDLMLVMDGYEQATHCGVDAEFGRFLDLAPETLHVVVSTRGEPELALPLRRARGTVVELGATELSFDRDETTALLRRALGAAATDVDAAAVARRTEGWPAAVYLAALVAQAAPVPAEALAGFSGATRDLADYLRLELLDAQRDEALRSFLLETSVLERLSAPLCDALLGRRDSGAMLRKLARGGAFLLPVEGPGRGYRYLRPVQEFLRVELSRVTPERVIDLHRRAAVA